MERSSERYDNDGNGENLIRKFSIRESFNKFSFEFVFNEFPRNGYICALKTFVSCTMVYGCTYHEQF